MGTGGEDVSILTDRKCEILSDPYPRYESQDTGIYMVMRVLAYEEICLEQSSSLLRTDKRGRTVRKFGSDKRTSSPTRVKPFNHAP